MKCKHCGREIYQDEERTWIHKGVVNFGGSGVWCPGPGTMAEPS